MGVDKYAALCKCMYIFIIVNQLTTQTACDYHKVGMSVKGRLVGTHRTHLHSHDLEVRGQGTPLEMDMTVFPRQNLV